MDIGRLQRLDDFQWRIPAQGDMRVPGLLFGDRTLMEQLDDKVYEQLRNVAMLPGIVGAAYAMPDAHWGYGFPIGGVAAFDPDEGGVVSAGGVGFDISCGVRTLLTDLDAEAVRRQQRALADRLFECIPAGIGSTGRIRLDDDEMDAMLSGGARWAVDRGYGDERDLDRIEERGRKHLKYWSGTGEFNGPLRSLSGNRSRVGSDVNAHTMGPCLTICVHYGTNHFRKQNLPYKTRP